MTEDTFKYEPDFIVTPGMIINDYLEGLDMTQSQLALRTGLSEKTISEIINAKAPITPETALKFESVLGRPAHFWNNLEVRYQDKLIRKREKDRLLNDIEWTKEFPIASMVKFKWIEQFNDPADKVNALLRFFGISSPDRWPIVWSQYQPVFRRDAGDDCSMEKELSVWLRQGEIQASLISCMPYDKPLFRNILKDIRELTLETVPEVFIPKLQEICAAAGVAVVFVPEIPKTRVHGATRWMKDKAIIQLSVRYKSNDHLWFTFFHEVAHILLHGRNDIFIECDINKNEKELEADNFSQNFLIPSAEFRHFISSGHFTLNTIQRFAQSINIAPGIVVGRLQHDRLLKPSFCNELKIRYKWII